MTCLAYELFLAYQRKLNAKTTEEFNQAREDYRNLCLELTLRRHYG